MDVHLQIDCLTEDGINSQPGELDSESNHKVQPEFEFDTEDVACLLYRM